tara:strand:- start:280 stop:495 length:216 start_codon:yes stop_codon:yes gene_type:complete
MKKIIPTTFAAVLAISSCSLLIGCDASIPDDPNAAENEAREKSSQDDNTSEEEKKKFDDLIAPPPAPEENK